MYEAAKKDDATLIASSFQCRRDGGECQYKLPGSGVPAGGPRPIYVAYVFIILGSIIIC